VVKVPNPRTSISAYCEHGEGLVDAAMMYRTRSIDLHDCFLGAIASQRGTRVLSFDADLRNLGVSEKP
jgi:predicted nucleic acid-binding protein